MSSKERSEPELTSKGTWPRSLSVYLKTELGGLAALFIAKKKPAQVVEEMDSDKPEQK